jgi:hypothetical protein
MHKNLAICQMMSWKSIALIFSGCRAYCLKLSKRLLVIYKTFIIRSFTKMFYKKKNRKEESEMKGSGKWPAPFHFLTSTVQCITSQQLFSSKEVSHWQSKISYQLYNILTLQREILPGVSIKSGTISEFRLQYSLRY